MRKICIQAMTIYKVKEIYYTIQGEGRHAGRPMVFCRFAGCNFWNGRELDRLSAACNFCDTDFIGTDGENGGKYSASELSQKIISLWPQDSPEQVAVVCTGGEPLLQMDDELVQYMHKAGIYIAIESNGTIKAPKGIDWICVSPKGDATLNQISGDELKLVYPQIENTPNDFQELDFKHFFFFPLDDPQWVENTKSSIEFVKNNPKWKLSTQTHKYLNIP